LARQINDEEFYVPDNDGALDLQAQRDSLRTLNYIWLPSENHINYFTQAARVYGCVKHIVIKVVFTVVSP
jgi:hypothetical protein